MRFKINIFILAILILFNISISLEEKIALKKRLIAQKYEKRNTSNRYLSWHSKGQNEENNLDNFLFKRNLDSSCSSDDDETCGIPIPGETTTTATTTTTTTKINKIITVTVPTIKKVPYTVTIKPTIIKKLTKKVNSTVIKRPYIKTITNKVTTTIKKPTTKKVIVTSIITKKPTTKITTKKITIDKVTITNTITNEPKTKVITTKKVTVTKAISIEPKEKEITKKVTITNTVTNTPTTNKVTITSTITEKPTNFCYTVEMITLKCTGNNQEGKNGALKKRANNNNCKQIKTQENKTCQENNKSASKLCENSETREQYEFCCSLRCAEKYKLVKDIDFRNIMVKNCTNICIDNWDNILEKRRFLEELKLKYFGKQ